jgi:hypothetical protein
MAYRLHSVERGGRRGTKERVMKLEFSMDEASFIRSQLSRRLADLEDELVHTDKRELQAALAAETDRLRHIERTLGRMLDEADVAA